MKIGKVERPRRFSPPAGLQPFEFEPERYQRWIYSGSSTFSHLLSSLCWRSAIHEHISHWPEILPLPANMGNPVNTLDLRMLQLRPGDQNHPLFPPAKLGEVNGFRVS